MSRNKTISSGFGLFTPNKVQGLTENRASIVGVTASQQTGSIKTHVSASYRYDDPGNPLKSTQQLNIDWTKFENHTFFNSAEAKVNMAFETIINNYPFDGDVGEIFDFEDKLTGFEKHVLERLPQYTGFLNFNQSQFITVADRAGTLYPALSRNTTAQSILDPGLGPLTYEMHVLIPVNRGGNAASDKQVIAQKIKNNNGVTLYTEPTAASPATKSDIVLTATSGSVSASARVSLKRGKWHHLSACLNRNPGNNRIEIFVDGKFKAKSDPFEIFDFGFTDQALTIGSGANITASGDISAVTFNAALSGSLDDFRVFHSSRSESALDAEKTRKVEPRKTLKLNFTFNEPTGSYNNQAVLLDHSGNSLHSTVTNYVAACRVDGGYGNPMVQEDPSRFPVLFPSHPDLVDYNRDLMVSASNYDTNNPNMITKLVPEHYLREAHFNEGFDPEKELGDSEDEYGYNTDFPGGGKIGSPQIIASLLFIWAKQFDEMKLYLDQFGKVLHADYRDEDTVADTFLPFMAEYFGFELPDMFPNTSQSQFVGREGQGTDQALAKLSLQKIQNTIWRRVLSDIREIMRSKGTIHGIKTFLRNVGIDPDRNFRFREYGGSRTGRIGGARQEVKEIGRLLSFSDSLKTGATSTLTGSLPKLVPGREPGSKTVFTTPMPQKGGMYSASPLIVSPFLSGTRVEPGAPYPQVNQSEFLFSNSSSYSGAGEKIVRSGEHVKFGVSPEPSDGLFTSGSWTCEAMYVYGGSHTIGLTQPVTQSLMRMYVTGTIMRSAGDPSANDPAASQPLKEPAKAKLTFASQPAEAATITLVDNKGSAVTKVFEFDSNSSVAGSNVSVTIGTSLESTVKNLVTAINGESTLNITATVLGTGRDVRLVMDDPGTPGTPIIQTTQSPASNCTTSHFLGGFDDEILTLGAGSAFDGVNGQTGRTMVTNLIALSGSDDLQTTGSLVLFARPVPNRPALVMSLTGTNIFDGDRWNICYGRIRNDLSGTHVSSSYFLQASKAMGDRLAISNRVEKLFDDHQQSLTSGETKIKLAGVVDTDEVVITDDAVPANTRTYRFVSGDGVAATGTEVSSGVVRVNITGMTTNSQKASELKTAILSANGHNSDTKATSTIVVPARSSASDVTALKSNLDTDTFTLTDAEGNVQKFTYRVSTDDATIGIVGLKSDTTIEGIAQSIKTSINFAPGLKITATGPAGASDNAAQTIYLTQDIAGAAGNGSIPSAGTVSGTALTYNAFAGGTDAKFKVEATDDIVTLSQDSKIPVTATTSDSTITFPKKLSAANMSVLSNITNLNRSGSFLMVGDIDDTASAGKTYGLDAYQLSSNSNLDAQQSAMAQTTKFGGNIAQIRFWSKALTEKEHQEHALNFKSLGVENPAKNYNFVNNVEGSFEKLRLDVSVDQDVTGSDGLGTILLKDYTQQMFDMEGYGFGDKKQQIYPKTFKYSILSPNFDQSSQTNKVRVRSYLDPAVARRELVDVAPVYHIPKSEKIHDDLRFGIEISISQALNEDIINIMATMDEIENALGAPESQFDVGYLGLENIREVYFNRLTDKINMSNFFQFFRWFDNTIGGTIESLVPRKTKFTGVNYIIEPHLLERPKFTYNTSDMYLGENDRHGLKGEILLRQLVAVVRRF